MRKCIIFLIISCSCSVCARAELYAVFAGVSKYNDAASLEAPFLDGEARKMRDLFSKPDNPNVKLITNENVNRENLLNALKFISKKAGENDQILFFYAGRSINGNISAYDDATNGVSFEEINGILATSPSKTKIILMDNCNTDADNYHAENRAITAFKSENLFVLQASRPNEKSIGNKDLAGSYFTYYLVEGIQGKADLNADGRIDAFELYAYVSIRVSDKTDNQQHPVMSGTMDGGKTLFKSK